jgi:c-di-GMP-binding flagellar brake protein YcgR
VFSLFGLLKKKEPKRLLKAQPTAAQKRSSFRMPVQFDVLYALEGREGRRHGRVNDLSAGGLRLSSDEDLLPGSILELDFRLPDEFLSELQIEKEVIEQTPFGPRAEVVKVQPPPFAPVHVRAKVLSTFFDREARTLAHGVMFVDLEETTKEELQRFVHLWQLNRIRERRLEID